ncbi:hypothetical protein MKX01_039365, partial [Papaver californicum]
ASLEIWFTKNLKKSLERDILVIEIWVEVCLLIVVLGVMWSRHGVKEKVELGLGVTGFLKILLLQLL